MRAFTIEKLSIELGRKLNHSRLINAFSTNISDVFLEFDSLTIKVTFYKGVAYFQFPDPSKLQKKNRLPVFKNLVGQEVDSVHAVAFDRTFYISFSNGDILTFYLFGRFSQLAFYSNNLLVDHFPVKAKEVVEFIPNNNQLSILINKLNDANTIQSVLPFLTNEEVAFLENKNALNVNSEVKSSLLQEVRNKCLVHNSFYIYTLNNQYKLEVNKGIEEGGNNECEVITETDNLMDALDRFSRLHIAHQTFNETKNSHLAVLKRELKSLTKKQLSIKTRIEALGNAAGYRQKADLIMANLHQIKTNTPTVRLLNFEGIKEVVIKLNKNISPQANAERYYKKAKNESKQIEFAQQSLEQLNSQIRKKQLEIEEYAEITELKQLRRIADNAKQQKDIRLPYKQLKLAGFEIRIGRGAKDNDELLRFHTSKNDIWLHAKDVSGSHVIIRNPNKIKIPAEVLEKAASLAAFYSKAKHESLSAVIYTERKYVRKPKGATPGLVKVDKEDVLLVEPKEVFK
jgi:predicted ribosome quality control (RQC) complex YloA/Tae2 family protein